MRHRFCEASCIFRRQKVGEATEWNLGAQNYPLGSTVVFVTGTLEVGDKPIRLCGFGEPVGTLKGKYLGAMKYL